MGRPNPQRLDELGQYLFDNRMGQNQSESSCHMMNEELLFLRFLGDRFESDEGGLLEFRELSLRRSLRCVIS